MPIGAEGAVAGISYHIQGDGPPLVLLPLSLASSQWDPLLPRLSMRFRIVTLGGPAIGFLAMLESRGQAALAANENLTDVITFQEGDAEALPFPDNHVDVALSFTVLEEGNADRILAELVRVVKPGGRVAVMVRALDIPWVVNVPLRPETKTKVQMPRGFVGAKGCADPVCTGDYIRQD
jgi:SAM-dependent methyltransferase